MPFDLRADESQPDLMRRARAAKTKDLRECIDLYGHSEGSRFALASVRAEVTRRDGRSNFWLAVAAYGGLALGGAALIAQIIDLYKPG